MTSVAELRDFFPDDMEIPDDFEERVRAMVYPSLEAMPADMRRDQRISWMMAMLPEGMGWTREQVAEYIDRKSW